VVQDGRVYFGGVDGLMHKIKATSGEKEWEVVVNDKKAIFATPVLDANNLYFGTVGNQLLALSRKDGANALEPIEVNHWGSGNLDIIASPVLVDATISFGANDDNLYFFDTAGSPLTSVTSANNITASAAVDGNTLYVGGWDGRLSAINASGSGIYSSTPLWQYPPAAQAPLPARLLSTPIVADGQVYFGGGNNLTVSLAYDTGETSTTSFNTTSGDDQKTVNFTSNVTSWSITFDQEDKTLYCLNANDGSLAWSFAIDGSVVGRPAIVDQTLFVSTLAGRVTALDITSGKPSSNTWQSAKFGPLYSAPVVANGRVYVGSEDHSLYCLDAATGKTLWSMKTGGAIIASPVVADGKIYAASLDGVLYCISE